MNNLNIQASLCVCPTVNTLPVRYIKRGEQIRLTFNNFTKVYGMSQIDQLTWLFKQGKNFYKFKMLHYLKPVAEAVPTPGKEYYCVYGKPDSHNSDNFFKAEDYFKEETAKYHLDAHKIIFEAGGQFNSENTYYEEITTEDEKNCSWRDTYFRLDPHFAQDTLDPRYFNGLVDKAIIYLNLSSEETLKFKITGNALVTTEIIIRANTDCLDQQQDSLIIEPQESLAVINTLYGEAFDKQERGSL